MRDHKSQLSQKKVTHGLTVVYEAFFLRHILIYFSRSGQNPFGDDEAASPPSSLVCIPSWMLAGQTGEEDWHNLFMTSSSLSKSPQSRKGAKVPFEVPSQRNFRLLEPVSAERGKDIS